MFREKTVPTAKGPPKNSTQPWQGRTLGENEEEEDLADSGRLFVRNLPYTSSEEDLEKIFSRYGRDKSPGAGRTPRAQGVRAGGRVHGLVTAPSCLRFLISETGLKIPELLWGFKRDMCSRAHSNRSRHGPLWLSDPDSQPAPSELRTDRVWYPLCAAPCCLSSRLSIRRAVTVRV